jgi:hypothetical protein
MGLSGLISQGPPEMLREECQTSENKTQTQVAGGKEDLLLADQHLDLSKKWHRPHSSRLWGFYASECRSKQAGRTKADLAVSLLLGGCNVSD